MTEDPASSAPAGSGCARPAGGTEPDYAVGADMGLDLSDPVAAEWYARNRAKIERWRRPLATLADRLAAWVNMLFVDHGIFRLIHSNTWRVGRNVWRSSQPAPHDIARFARRGGRTVVTLRGGQAFGSLPLEVEACARHGLALRAFTLRSRALPSREDIDALEAFLGEIEYPALFHCKSGADRAGMMSALYLILREDVPVERARRQLALKFGHIRQSKTGVLDAFFEAYIRDARRDGLSFRDWLATRYDPDAISRQFKATGWGSLIGDRLLRRE